MQFEIEWNFRFLSCMSGRCLEVESVMYCYPTKSVPDFRILKWLVSTYMYFDW